MEGYDKTGEDTGESEGKRKDIRETWKNENNGA